MKYTKEYLEPLVKESINICDLMRKIGISPRGGGHALLRKRIELYQLDTSHFRKRWSPRSHKFKAHTVESFLQFVLIKNGKNWSSNVLKKKMLELGLIKEVCAECGSKPVWNGKRLSLHLDHKDGDSRNNIPENLRLLCPNCHSQTSTYAGKKRI